MAWIIDMIFAELLAFTDACAKAFPEHCTRDRFGRYTGARDTDPLRQLAVKYKVGMCVDSQDQAGKVARAILNQNKE